MLGRERPLRLCAIGNSHLAALRSGWGLCAAVHPAMQVTWFGAMWDGIAQLRRVGGALRADHVPKVEATLAWTSGGLRQVVFEDYDAFLLVGLGLSFTSLARLYGANRTLSQSKALPFKRLLSEAAFEAASKGLVHGSPSLTLACVIREATMKPLLLVPDPRPSEAAANGPEAALWRHLASYANGGNLLARFAAQAQNAAKSVNAVFVPQPPETCANPPFTHDRLRRGAVRMKPSGDTLFEETDVGHMGPEYGVSVINSVVVALSIKTF
jgi:hypothetical protein